MNTITIDSIVDKVIVREQLSDHHYARIFDIALDGYRDLFRGVFPNYKTLLLTWNNDEERYINYPSDYDKYLIVGVPFIMPSGNMSILTLSKNDLLYFDKPVECECTCVNNVAVESVSETLNLLATGEVPFTQTYPFGRTYRDGQYVGELFGLGGGQSYMGSFTEDIRNKRFCFGRDVPAGQEIVLRYRPTAVDVDGQSVKGIPEAAQEALIAWTQWKILNRRNSSKADRDEGEYRYLVERDKLNMQLNGMNASEIIDAFFEGLTFGIAR